MSTVNSIHQFEVDGLNGKRISFSDFAGKKILVVNVASECGFTPQYEALQELFEESRDKLVVVGVPCNDFGGQEPGTAAEIKEFCRINYGVSFPLTAKMKILSTPQSPLYSWLCSAEQNGVKNCEVKWNFHKFLLNEKGELISDYPSDTIPLDDL